MSADELISSVGTLLDEIDNATITASVTTDPSRARGLMALVRQNQEQIAALLAASSTQDRERFNRDAKRMSSRIAAWDESKHKRDARGRFAKSESRSENAGRYGGRDPNSKIMAKKKGGGGGGGGGGGSGSDKAAKEAERKAKEQQREAERQQREAERQKKFDDSEAEREAREAREADRDSRYGKLRDEVRAAEDALDAHVAQLEAGYESYEAERAAARAASVVANGAVQEYKMLLREAEDTDDVFRQRELKELIKGAEETAKEAMRRAVHLDAQRDTVKRTLTSEKSKVSRERARLRDVLAAQRESDAAERRAEAAARRAKAEAERLAREEERRAKAAADAAERAAKAAEKK
jgi:hypothetical protein